MEIYYGKPTPNSFSDILDQYSPKEINSIKTSTIPFLNYWKNTQERMSTFLQVLDIESVSQTLAFEYPTRSFGSNKASMTDLMIFCDNCRIAIEAKYTEVVHQYQTVREWYKGKSENRDRVINHWFSFLEPFVTTSLNVESVMDIPYQFIHRTASACANNEKNACVVYQIFYDKETEAKAFDFSDFLAVSVKLLKPRSTLCIYTVSIPIIPPLETVEIASILQCLKKEDLYQYGEMKCLRLIP